MKYFLFLVLSIGCWGQTSTVTIASPTSAKAGSNVVVTAGQTGGSPAASQFVLQVTPATAVTNVLATITGSAALPAANKSLNCGASYSSTTGLFNCIISNTNLNTITDGAEISYTVTLAKSISGTVTFGLANTTMEATPLGGLIAIATPLPSSSMSIISLCDLNGDGAVNASDYGLILSWVLGTSTVPSGQTCDKNNDGTCNLLDVMILINALQPAAVCSAAQ